MTSSRRPALLLTLLVLACSEPPPPEWHEAGDHRWRELRVSGGDPGFTVMDPGRTGIEFANTLDVERALDNEHLLIGSGVALGDVDGDGLTDVYLSRLQGPNRLYRNLGGWAFEDVTRRAGVAAADRYSTGTSMADVDGDGDLDLLVTSLGGPDVLYRNDGTGRFTAVEEAGLADGLGSSTPAFADVDGDGDLDLYQTTYKSESASDVLRLLERSPSEVYVRRGDSTIVAPEYRGHYRIEEREGRQVAVEQAEPDRLYLNDGSGRFEPVSWTGGAFLDEEGRPLEREIDDFGLAARFHDVDGDGDPDLYVCNDFDDPDQLWLNRGDGTFRATPRLSLRTTSHASMSVDFSDVDRDGHVDIFVAEMRTRHLRRRLLTVPFQGRLRKPLGVFEDRPQVQRNTLFLARGDGTWVEIAQLAGVDASEWTWGSLFLDVDLDGYEDLLAANGYSRDTQHGDVVDRISSLQGQADSRELKRLYPRLENRNVAFRNRGDLTFEDVGRRWGVGTEPDVSHGIAPGDLDGDGDLDLVVNRLGSPARVLRNDSEAARIAVRLRSSGSNTRGVGATVRVLGGAVPVQEKEMTAGGLYLSSADPLLVFAAGETDSLVVEVDWPDGRRSVVRGARPDRLYEIRQEGARRIEEPRPVSGPPAALFEDRSEALDHRHPETQFEDFQRQPLLPYQASRLGPGVTWTDVDDDGDPDLVVPPGAGGRASWLRNEDGRFDELFLEDSAGSLDRTAAVALPTPEAGAAPRIGVGQANYEAATVEEARGVPPVQLVAPDAGRAGPRGLGESGLASTGPLATADVDGDGDLDLFVGGRIVKGFYPLATSSRLFLSEGDELREDTAAVLEEIGLVSGAVFSDVDVDGDPDLLLALEWGRVRVLRNDGGRFVDATGDWGLSRLYGRWNGITTGDLNADGRPDVVVTGWGRNLRDRPEEGRPLVLYHDDLDRNGTWDAILAQPPEPGAEPRPLVGFQRLRVGLPSVRSRVDGFEGYADADMEQVLGVPPDEVFRKVAREYDHLVLWNRGDRFEAEALPVEAQFAPATGVVVGDLDGDGHEDLFLSQNFFPTHLFAARHDAGLGLALLGDGGEGLRPLPPARSGIRIHGDQRGAALADYDGDARVDLAVGQNGAATKLFRNAAAAPGLRVRLEGPPGNPDGIGARLRVEYADRLGPVREVHGGSGYWSASAPEQVMGLAADPVAVRVRWPDGSTSRVRVPPDRREITVRKVTSGG